MPKPTTSGGSNQKSHAKSARPFAPRAPVHLVLRAQKGQPSLKRRGREIESQTREIAQNLGVKVHAFANVGNHLHVVITARTRKDFCAYLRGVSGTIARIALGAARGRKRLTAGTAFWLGRPFTRLATWGREYRVLLNYVEINQMEGAARTTKAKAREILERIRTSQLQLKQGEIASLTLYGFSLG